MRFDDKTTKQKADKVKISKLSAVQLPAHEDALAKIIKSKQPAVSPAKTNNNEGNMDLKEIEKKINEAVAPMQEKLAKAEAMAGMNDKEKEFYANLEEDKKEGFIKMSSDERRKEIDKLEDLKKSKGDDETFEMHGKMIKKSAVGEDVFFILKAQKEETERTKADLIKEREKRENQEFAKMAEGLYPNLPGKDTEKGLVLKAMKSMDIATKDILEKMLKAGDEGLGKSGLFKEFGVAPDMNEFDETPMAKLNKMADEKANKEGIDRYKAYADVLKSPEGQKLYTESMRG